MDPQETGEAPSLAARIGTLAALVLVAVAAGVLILRVSMEPVPRDEDPPKLHLPFACSACHTFEESSTPSPDSP